MENAPKLTLVENSQNILTRLYAEWKKATVNIDYHIEIDRHYYSVPFQWIREKLGL